MSLIGNIIVVQQVTLLQVQVLGVFYLVVYAVGLKMVEEVTRTPSQNKTYITHYVLACVCGTALCSRCHTEVALFNFEQCPPSDKAGRTRSPETSPLAFRMEEADQLDELLESIEEEPRVFSPKIVSFLSKKRERDLLRQCFLAWYHVLKEDALQREKDRIFSKLKQIHDLEDEVLAGRLAISSQAKRRLVYQAFNWLGIIAVVFLFLVTFYYDYVMLQQCWTALGWALCGSVCLAKVWSFGLTSKVYLPLSQPAFR